MPVINESVSKRGHYRIAYIPGDGIGIEVLAIGRDAVNLVADRYNFSVDWLELDWSCQRYLDTGRMMPEDGINMLAKMDAIYLGAVGWPGVPDHVSLWGLLIPIRRSFDQYVNLRPVRLLENVASPLAGRSPKDINFVIVRENTEGEYSDLGGRLFADTDRELVLQQAVFSRRGCDRIIRYAFDLALSRRGHVTSATKSNGIVHSMPYWDERFAEISDEYGAISTAQFHIDILVAHFVLHPDWFDVVVGSNLFGDILSDLGPAIAGSIGIAPSANINPSGKMPSMFEPVHGSAPDIAGKGVANPIGAIWAASMMLDHLGEREAAAQLMDAIECTIATESLRTQDLGGQASTEMLGGAILEELT